MDKSVSDFFGIGCLNTLGGSRVFENQDVTDDLADEFHSALAAEPLSRRGSGAQGLAMGHTGNLCKLAGTFEREEAHQEKLHELEKHRKAHLTPSSFKKSSVSFTMGRSTTTEADKVT